MSRYNAPTSSSRDALFGNNAAYTPLNTSSSSKLVSWNDDDEDDDEVEDTEDYGSVHQIRQKQQHMIQDQDKNLEALSEVISRQKNLAQTIGNEVDYQNDLIEDITDHVDRTRDRIADNTGRVRTIDRKDATGRYWAIILLLLVIIIIITLV